MKNKLWIFFKKTKDVGYSYEVKEKFRYFKGSTISILLGLLAACVIVSIQNVNPFSYLVNLIGMSFNGLYVNQTLQWISIYIIAGLAVAIAFKSGSFNIGLAGQMLLGAGLSIIFVKQAILNQGQTVTVLHTFIILLICVGSGALLAGFAGLLKALFNIHEVVTTIMLNWTVWYLFKYIFSLYSDTLGGDGIAVSASIPPNLITVGNSEILIPILIALVTLIFVGILLSKTVFGFKIKAVGLNQDASKYSGYSVKQKIIQAMIISGLLAGLASFVNLTTITPNLNFAIDNLPTIGYDSIAISLVAFNNPVGIFFTSFLWGTLNSSGTSTASLFGIPSQLSALIFGIIVYFSAISVVFIQYYPILKLRISLAVLESRKNRIEIARLQRLQNQYRFKLVKIKNEKEVVDYKQQIEIAKNQALATYEKSQKTRQDLQEFNAKLAQLKKDYHEYISEYRKTLIEVIKKLKYDINNLKTETYIGKINHAKSGINRRHFRYVRNLEINAVEKHSNLHTTKLLAKDQLKLERDNRIYYKRNETKKAKQVRKSSLRSNYYWYEGHYGDLTNYYLMINTKIEKKGEIKKGEIFLSNQIASLKADLKFEKSQLKLNKQQVESNEEIKKIKNEITKAKLNFKLLKVKNNEEIKQTKQLHKQTLKDLKQITKIKDLKREYQTMNKQTKNEYSATINTINQNLILIENKVNLAQSQRELIQVQNLLTNYQRIKKKESKTLIQAKKNVDRFEKLCTEIKKIYPIAYADYDSFKYIKAKYKFYYELVKEQENVESCQLILGTEQQIKNANNEHKEITTAYDLDYKKLNKNYKTQIKIIKDDLSIDKFTRYQILVEREDEYHEQINKLVKGLEKKFIHPEGSAK